MEIKSPKEEIQKATSLAESAKNEIFGLKQRNTINGALFGGLFGFLYGNFQDKNLMMTSVIGMVAGGVVSNLLTIKK